jgi:hypothetical protein
VTSPGCGFGHALSFVSFATRINFLRILDFVISEAGTLPVKKFLPSVIYQLTAVEPNPGPWNAL